MVWEPRESAEVETIAWPLPSTAVGPPRIVPAAQVPSLKVTLPVVTAVAGVPLVTVAVKVTDSPELEGFCDEVTPVEVATAVAFTT